MDSLKIFLLAFLATSLSATAADFPKLSLRYVADWPQLPEGVNFGITTGVGVDSANNVYVYNRGPDPVLCFDASGKYLRTWGRGLLTESHGLAVDADDNIWVTDIGSHVVVKFNSRGRVLMVLGQKDTPGESENQFKQPGAEAGPGRQGPGFFRPRGKGPRPVRPRPSSDVGKEGGTLCGRDPKLAGLQIPLRLAGRALRFESSGEVRTANRLPSSTPPTHVHSRLWLLPSGPDQVHGRPLWRTPRSTPSHGTE